MNTDEQILIVVDDKNKPLGYAPRGECHSGSGKKHRAFVTLLFDSQDNVLLQKRKHRLFDNRWDLTAISHPLHNDGHDETFQEASDRALVKEMGISHVLIENIGAFNYFALDGENCENEYCAVLKGEYNGEYTPNPAEVYDVRKIPFKQFIASVRTKPNEYTPWAKLAASVLGKHFKAS